MGLLAVAELREHVETALADAALARIPASCELAIARWAGLLLAAAESSAAANPHVDIDTAISYIRNFAANWTKTKPLTRAILIQSIYAQIVVRGEDFVSLRLTPEAYAHGLALMSEPFSSVFPTTAVLGPFAGDRGRPLEQPHLSARRRATLLVAPRSATGSSGRRGGPG